MPITLTAISCSHWSKRGYKLSPNIVPCWSDATFAWVEAKDEMGISCPVAASRSGMPPIVIRNWKHASSYIWHWSIKRIEAKRVGVDLSPPWKHLLLHLGHWLLILLPRTCWPCWTGGTKKFGIGAPPGLIPGTSYGCGRSVDASGSLSLSEAFSWPFTSISIDFPEQEAKQKGNSGPTPCLICLPLDLEEFLDPKRHSLLSLGSTHERISFWRPQKYED